MTVLEVFNIFFYALLIGSIFYNLASLYCVWDFFGREKKQTSHQLFTPVSIIKPCKGVDAGFQKSIKAYCEQDYPDYEVLVGITDPADSLVEVKQIAASCNNIRIITSSEDIGSNKKVSNLHGLAASAKYNLLAVSDSDMRVERSYLKKIVSEYNCDKNIGLVTCLYKITHPPSAGAALESLTIALDFIPSVLVARKLEGVTFGLGATLLISKKGLDEIGGFPIIADYLADDYQIGNRLWQHGYKIVLSDVVVENIVGPMSISDYFFHQLRWARTCRISRPTGYVGYGITHLFAISLFFLAINGPTALTLSVLATTLVLRFCLASMLSAWVIDSKKWLKWLVLIPVKDMLSFAIWVWSFFSNKVTWKGISYRILKGGRIKEDALSVT
jgi:ceramide glucosyltransferase